MGLFDQKSPTYSLFYIYRVDRSLEGLEIIKKIGGSPLAKKSLRAPGLTSLKSYWQEHVKCQSQTTNLI